MKRFIYVSIWNNNDDMEYYPYTTEDDDAEINRCAELLRGKHSKAFCSWKELTVFQSDIIEVAKYLVADQDVDSYVGNLIHFQDLQTYDLFSEIAHDHFKTDKSLLAWAQLLFWDEGRHLFDVLRDIKLTRHDILREKFRQEYTVAEDTMYPDEMLSSFLSMLPRNIIRHARKLEKENPLAYLVALCPMEPQSENEVFIDQLLNNDFCWGSVQFNRNAKNTLYDNFKLIEGDNA